MHIVLDEDMQNIHIGIIITVKYLICPIIVEHQFSQYINSHRCSK